MGLGARFLEEKGFSTVVLTPTHEFHKAIGVPRTAAIEYPYGRPVGEAQDRDGQRRVLVAALEVLEKAQKPGETRHLPFSWPQDPRQTDWQPPEMSPLIRLYLEEIKQARKQAR